MSWDGVPWAVGGGAVIQVEALRTVAYLAAGSRQGVAGPGDAAVLAAGPAAALVRVMPGAVVALNAYEGGVTSGEQAWVARNPSEHTVAITPNSGSTVRRDLVAVIIEDPQYVGQPAPASVANGPYVRTVVYPNVPAGTTTLAQVDSDQTGVALALVTMAAGATTVAQAAITDLRQLVAPRSVTVTRFLNLGSGAVTLTAAALTVFPLGASWQVDVPPWATVMHLRADVANLRVGNDATDAGDWSGTAVITLGSETSEFATVRPSIPAANRIDNYGYVVADEMAVPASLRGTTQTLAVKARRDSVSSGVTLAHDTGSLVVVTAVFYETPNTDVWS